MVDRLSNHQIVVGSGSDGGNDGTPPAETEIAPQPDNYRNLRRGLLVLGGSGALLVIARIVGDLKLNAEYFADAAAGNIQPEALPRSWENAGRRSTGPAPIDPSESRRRRHAAHMAAQHVGVAAIAIGFIGALLTLRNRGSQQSR